MADNKNQEIISIPENIKNYLINLPSDDFIIKDNYVSLSVKYLIEQGIKVFDQYNYYFRFIEEIINHIPLSIVNYIYFDHNLDGISQYDFVVLYLNDNFINSFKENYDYDPESIFVHIKHTNVYKSNFCIIPIDTRYPLRMVNEELDKLFSKYTSEQKCIASYIDYEKFEIKIENSKPKTSVSEKEINISTKETKVVPKIEPVINESFQLVQHKKQPKKINFRDYGVNITNDDTYKITFFVPCCYYLNNKYYFRNVQIKIINLSTLGSGCENDDECFNVFCFNHRNFDERFQQFIKQCCKKQGILLGNYINSCKQYHKKNLKNRTIAPVKTSIINLINSFDHENICNCNEIHIKFQD